MRRYGLRDDQWDRIKDLLPGREGHGEALPRTIGCLSKLSSTDLEQDVPGATYLSGLVIGKRSTNGSAGGRKAGSSSVFSSCWPRIMTTNT
jgi:hypothetical protein